MKLLSLPSAQRDIQRIGYACILGYAIVKVECNSISVHRSDMRVIMNVRPKSLPSFAVCSRLSENGLPESPSVNWKLMNIQRKIRRQNESATTLEPEVFEEGRE